MARYIDSEPLIDFYTKQIEWVPDKAEYAELKKACEIARQNLLDEAELQKGRRTLRMDTMIGFIAGMLCGHVLMALVLAVLLWKDGREK